MGSLWQDLRLGIRGLLKSPGFTVIAVLTLALGIGANTAIFTVLNAVLLRALPAEEPHRLVMLSNPEYHGIGVGDGSGKRGMYAYSEFRDLLEKNQVFSGVLAVDSYVRRTDVSIEGARSPEPEHANVTMVSGDYFHVLGIRPCLGRTFTAEVDKVQHANPVAVISHGYWKRRFAQNPVIIGHDSASPHQVRHHRRGAGRILRRDHQLFNRHLGSVDNAGGGLSGLDQFPRQTQESAAEDSLAASDWSIETWHHPGAGAVKHQRDAASKPRGRRRRNVRRPQAGIS